MREFNITLKNNRIIELNHNKYRANLELLGIAIIFVT